MKFAVGDRVYLKVTDEHLYNAQFVHYGTVEKLIDSDSVCMIRWTDGLVTNINEIKIMLVDDANTLMKELL